MKKWWLSLIAFSLYFAGCGGVKESTIKKKSPVEIAEGTSSAGGVQGTQGMQGMQGMQQQRAAKVGEEIPTIPSPPLEPGKDDPFKTLSAYKSIKPKKIKKIGLERAVEEKVGENIRHIKQGLPFMWNSVPAEQPRPLIEVEAPYVYLPPAPKPESKPELKQEQKPKSIDAYITSYIAYKDKKMVNLYIDSKLFEMVKEGSIVDGYKIVDIKGGTIPYAVLEDENGFKYKAEYRKEYRKKAKVEMREKESPVAEGMMQGMQGMQGMGMQGMGMGGMQGMGMQGMGMGGMGGMIGQRRTER